LVSWAFQHRKIHPEKEGSQILRDVALGGQLYLGFYHLHLDRWFKVFDPSQFLILIYEEDIAANRERTAKRLTQFLEVDDFNFAGLTDRYNVRQTYKQEGDSYLLPMRRPDGRVDPKLGWEPFITADEVARVRDAYRDVPTETGQLIGRDLSVWNGH
jgi:hypothetical protein